MARPSNRKSNSKATSSVSRRKAAPQKTPSPVPQQKQAVPDSPGTPTSPFIPPNAAASRARESKTIPTSSRILADGSFLELVREPQPEAQARLLRWANGESSIAREFAAFSSRYAPSEAAAVIRHLPAAPSPYGSTAALFSEVRAFITKHTSLNQDDATVVASICVSSFFYDVVILAACLLLFGPPISAVSLLRVLACLSRHAILSAGSNTRGLPPELRPTRLICQPDAAIDKDLAALLFPGFGISSPDLQQISGTTVLYLGERDLKTSFADACFGLVLSDGPSFSVLDEGAELPTITRIQNELLMYRLQNHAQVKASQFDVPDFSGFTREFARTLGGCIVDAPDLQARLIELLRPHDEADRTKYKTAVEAIILESLIVCCHERRQNVHVGELAKLANDILETRGESVKLSPRQVGGRLKRIGIQTTRLDSGGRGVYLLNGQCARIHELGRAFGVATLREGLPGCRYCQSQ